MKLKFNQDLIGSTLFLILSIIIWLMIPSQIKANEGYLITSQTFPRVIVGLMGLSSLYLFIKEIIKVIKKEPVTKVEIYIKEEFKSIVVILLLIGYWIILHWLTFMASSIIFGICMLVFYKNKNWKYYGIVVVSIVLITIVFQNLLGVNLP